MARTKPIARHLIVSVYESDIKTGKKKKELSRIKLFMLEQDEDSLVETWLAGVMKYPLMNNPQKRAQAEHRPKARESVWHIVTKLLQNMNFGQIRVDKSRSVKGGKPFKTDKKGFVEPPEN